MRISVSPVVRRTSAVRAHRQEDSAMILVAGLCLQVRPDGTATFGAGFNDAVSHLAECTAKSCQFTSVGGRCGRTVGQVMVGLSVTDVSVREQRGRTLSVRHAV